MNVPYYIAAIALFFAFLYASGRAVWPGARTHPFHLPVAVALGMGFWIAASFLLCMAGGYRPAILSSLFWGVLLAALAWALVRWQAEAAAVAAWWRDLRAWDLVLLVLMVVPALLVAILPLLSADANVYHLAVPDRYLQAGGFREIPYLVYSNWPLGMELLFGWALAVGDLVLAKLVHWGCGVLLVLTLYRYCDRMGHPVAGLSAAALFLVSEIVRLEMSWAYVDLAQAWLFFLAFVVWDEAVDGEDPRQRRRGLWLAAVLLGIVAGVKLTGLACAMILAACHLLLGDRRIRELAVLLGVPLLLWMPWAFKSWLYTHNPVYPLAYGVFGGPYLNAGLVQQLWEWHHTRIGMGRGLEDYLLLPYRIVFESGPEWERFHGRLHPAWAAGIPLAVIGAVLDRRCRRLLMVAVLFGGFWAMGSQQLRLLIPALPFLAAGAGLAAVKLWRRWLPVPGWGPAWLVVLGCLGAVWGVWSTVREARVGLDASWSFRPALSGGLETGEVLLLGRAPGAGRGLPDYLRHVNEELPEDARVMFLRANGGYFCEREYVCDSFLEVSQLAAMLRQPGWLRAERITHVVVARDQLSGRQMPLPESLVSRLEQEQGFRRVFRGSDGDVYRVAPD